MNKYMSKTYHLYFGSPSTDTPSTSSMYSTLNNFLKSRPYTIVVDNINGSGVGTITKFTDSNGTNCLNISAIGQTIAQDLTFDTVAKIPSGSLYFYSSSLKNELNKEIVTDRNIININNNFVNGVTGYFNLAYNGDPGTNFIAAQYSNGLGAVAFDTFYSTGTLTWVIGVASITEILQSNVCFLAGSNVLTDQGEYAIEILKPGFTINQHKIIAITKTVTAESQLIKLEKDAIAPNYPNQTTVMSQLHKVMYKGRMVKAKDIPYAVAIDYDGQILYNVLMADYSLMTVNNLTVETLHPKNNIGIIYKYIASNNISQEEQNKIIEIYNTKTHLINEIRKGFFSNIVFFMILSVLNGHKTKINKVTTESVKTAFLPEAMDISKFYKVIA